MFFSYNGLWKLLIDKGMLKKDLAAAAKISPTTMSTMGKGGSMSLKTLGRICCVLNCDIGDIVNVSFDEKEQ